MAAIKPKIIPGIFATTIGRSRSFLKRPVGGSFPCDQRGCPWFVGSKTHTSWYTWWLQPNREFSSVFHSFSKHPFPNVCLSSPILQFITPNFKFFQWFAYLKGFCKKSPLWASFFFPKSVQSCGSSERWSKKRSGRWWERQHRRWGSRWGLGHY